MALIPNPIDLFKKAVKDLTPEQVQKNQQAVVNTGSTIANTVMNTPVGGAVKAGVVGVQATGDAFNWMGPQITNLGKTLRQNVVEPTAKAIQPVTNTLAAAPSSINKALNPIIQKGQQLYNQGIQNIANYKKAEADAWALAKNPVMDVVKQTPGYNEVSKAIQQGEQLTASTWGNFTSAVKVANDYVGQKQFEGYQATEKSVVSGLREAVDPAYAVYLKMKADDATITNWNRMDSYIKANPSVLLQQTGEPGKAVIKAGLLGMGYFVDILERPLRKIVLPLMVEGIANLATLSQKGSITDDERKLNKLHSERFAGGSADPAKVVFGDAIKFAFGQLKPDEVAKLPNDAFDIFNSLVQTETAFRATKDKEMAAVFTKMTGKEVTPEMVAEAYNNQKLIGDVSLIGAWDTSVSYAASLAEAKIAPMLKALGFSTTAKAVEALSSITYPVAVTTAVVDSSMRWGLLGEKARVGLAAVLDKDNLDLDQAINVLSGIAVLGTFFKAAGAVLAPVKNLSLPDVKKVDAINLDKINTDPVLVKESLKDFQNRFVRIVEDYTNGRLNLRDMTNLKKIFDALPQNFKDAGKQMELKAAFNLMDGKAGGVANKATNSFMLDIDTLRTDIGGGMLEAKRTIPHEMAHLLESGIKSDPALAKEWDALTGGVEFKNKVDLSASARGGDYGKNNPSEYFAEGMSKFIATPAQLKSEDPGLFAFMQKVVPNFQAVVKPPVFPMARIDEIMDSPIMKSVFQSKQEVVDNYAEANKLFQTEEPTKLTENDVPQGLVPYAIPLKQFPDQKSFLDALNENMVKGLPYYLSDSPSTQLRLFDRLNEFSGNKYVSAGQFYNDVKSSVWRTDQPAFQAKEGVYDISKQDLSKHAAMGRIQEADELKISNQIGEDLQNGKITLEEANTRLAQLSKVPTLEPIAELEKEAAKFGSKTAFTDWLQTSTDVSDKANEALRLRIIDTLEKNYKGGYIESGADLFDKIESQGNGDFVTPSNDELLKEATDHFFSTPEKLQKAYDFYKAHPAMSQGSGVQDMAVKAMLEKVDAGLAEGKSMDEIIGGGRGVVPATGKIWEDWMDEMVKKFPESKLPKGEIDWTKTNIDPAIIEKAKMATGVSSEDIFYYQKQKEAGIQPMARMEDPLSQEAKKYASAEEFVKNNLSTDKVSDYGMSHRPTPTGGLGSDITDNGNVMPKDIYEHPEYYFNMKDEVYQQSWSVLRRIKDNPEEKITIYRASPSDALNNGDWVTLSKKYAKDSIEGAETVHSFQVKAKDIQFAGDDINEFGYYPSSGKSILPNADQVIAKLEKETAYIQKNGKLPPTADMANYNKSEFYDKYGSSPRQIASAYYEFVDNKISKIKETQTKLTDIWNKAQGEPMARMNDSLANEAKKYSSADDFIKAQKMVLHGGDTPIDKFDSRMKGGVTGAQSAKEAFWFTDDSATAKAYSLYAAESGVVNKAMSEATTLEKIAQQSGKESDWAKYDKKVVEYEELASYDATFNRRANANIVEASIKGDFLEVDAKGKSPQELSKEGNIDSWLTQQIQKAKDMGKDGVVFKNLDDAVGLYNKPATHYAVFDPSNILTKSQLTDIWKQAQGDPMARLNPLAKDEIQSVTAAQRGTGGEVDRDIRWDKYSLDAPKQAALKTAVEDLGLGVRNVQTWEDVKILANDLGSDPVKLLRETEKGRLTAPENLALRNLIKANSEYIAQGQKKLALADDLLKKTPEYRILQAKVDVASNEIDIALQKILPGNTDAGRAVAINRLVAQNSLDPSLWLLKAQKMMEGQKIDDTKMGIVRATILDLISQKDRIGLSTYISSLKQSSNVDKLVTLWKAGLLTSPSTHIRNIGSNVIISTLEAVKDIPATAVDKLISAVTGTRTMALTNLADQFKGIPKGWLEAQDVIKYGVSMDDIGKADMINSTTFSDSPAGKVADGYTKFIFRTLGAEDKVFRTRLEYVSLKQQALVTAMNAGLKSGTPEFNTKVSDLMDSPTPAMLEIAKQDGLVGTFNNKNILSDMVNSAKRMTDGSPAGKFLLETSMPFVRTPTNVALRIADYSPVGIIKGLFEAALGKQRAGALDIGRGITGSAIIALGAMLAQKGIMTGNYPTSGDAKKLMYAQGLRAGDLIVGDKAINLMNISPLGNLLQVGASLYENSKADGLAAAIVPTAFTAAKGLTEQTFLLGLSKILTAVTDPQRGAATYAENLAGGMIPTVIRQLGEASDEFQRERNGIMDQIKVNTPGVRNTTLPMLDMFGHPKPTTGEQVLGDSAGVVEKALLRMLDPFQTRKVVDNRYLTEFKRLMETQDAVIPATPAQSGTFDLGSGLKAKYKMTDDTYNRFLEIQGRLLEESLKELMDNPDYANLDDKSKATNIDKVYRETKKTTLSIMLPVMLETDQQFHDDLMGKLEAAGKSESDLPVKSNPVQNLIPR